MNEVDIGLLPHQLDFVEDCETRYLGLCGGFGSGKSRAFCYKTVYLAMLNVGHSGAILEPTNAMVNDVLLPTLKEVLEEMRVKATFKASPYPTYTLHFPNGDCTILLRSAENYRRLAGLNLAFFGVDELDTISPSIARSVWRMLQSRLRKGNVYQGFTSSTPEGFRFLYDFFEKNKDKSDRRLIKARTQDNPFLPEDFIQSLLDNYPPELIRAYLDGEFVNLTNGVVYTSFDRTLNKTHITLNSDFCKNKVIHVGMDFNVGKMSATIAVIDNDIPYIVSEITNLRDTQAMIDTLKRMFPNRTVFIYPDSSGKAEKTNAARSDITLLKQSGFNVKHNTKNPRVYDRVMAVNTRFCNATGERHMFVNPDTCPVLTECLERQAYNEKGDPDKTTGFDHLVDALGYFVYYCFPLRTHRSQILTPTGRLQ